MLIGGRYEILEKIGTGGMSDVYKAKDPKLNRFVAVKVLKQEFSENRNFVSKFQVEAQAAAGLMHPNIVDVYDVGEENGIHYIVMELVEGITLKKYIEKKVRLTHKEAISIAIQVAMGIEAAHNNHIIHRDIKPQNIIISKAGKVKVTDFGIAKSASSNTITSNVMGSVHYTSPEQARGGFSDEKSDIYSMGITIFEMLTGRVPFNGDTTVSVAIKHIQDPMPLMSEFVPEVPISAENIVVKCTQKSPDKRYQNMGEMIKDLKHSLINPDVPIAQIDSEDDAGKTKTIAFQSNAAQNSTVNTPEPAPEPPMPEVLNTVWENRVPHEETYVEDAELEELPEQVKTTRNKNYDKTDYEGEEYDDPIYDEDDPYYEGYYEGDYEGEETEQPIKNKKQTKNSQKQKKSGSTSNTVKNNKTKKSGNTNKNKSNTNKQTSKPKKKDNKDYEYYEGDDYPQEQMNRTKVRLDDYENDSQYVKGYKKDEYDYNPKAEGLTTILTIIAAVIIGCIFLYFVGQATGIFAQIGATAGDKENSSSAGDGTELAVMPEFVGHNLDEVKTALNSVGLGFKSPTYIETKEYEKNQVISAALENGQEVKANDKIPKNTTIVLTVSAGANGINVPPVEGLPEAEGAAALQTEGFRVTRTEAFSEEYAKGLIISQSPEGNTIAPIGSEVAIIISKGKENIEVKMPRVLGNTKDAAISILEAAGLLVNVEETFSSEYPEGQICYQSYEADTIVNAGTMVELKVSKGAELFTYSCSLQIPAPQDYIGGNAEVILTTADGTEQLWYSQNVTAFPVSINLNGFSSPSPTGIVIITYLKNTEQVVTDADGNQTTQMSPTAAQTRQEVTFTKQG